MGLGPEEMLAEGTCCGVRERIVNFGPVGIKAGGRGGQGGVPGERKTRKTFLVEPSPDVWWCWEYAAGFCYDFCPAGAC